MNQMHGRYPINNDDFLYVLTTFIYEPIRWLDRFGWRPLTRAERLAFFLFYRAVGQRMNIKDIPDDYDVFEQFNRDYERSHFRPSPTNREIGNYTVALFLGFYLPRFMWGLGRPLIYAMMDEPLLDAFGFPHPPGWLRSLAANALRLRARVVRRLPERKHPMLGTQRRRPTYPEGYEIEELGAFPAPHSHLPDQPL